MEKNYDIHIDNIEQDIQIQIHDNETIEKLIEKIREVIKLPFKQIDVFYENNKLDLKLKMNTLQFNNSTILHVKLYLFIKIKVLIEQLGCCEISRINIYDKLACINKQIYNEFAISNYHLDLYHSQTLLEPHQSLYKQQILQDCELNCIVKASFLIKYKSEIYRFLTLLNEDFRNINEKIKQKLNLESDFELIYKEQIINNEGETYDIYSIPQNQQLELKILDRVILIVSSLETQSFKVSKTIQIKELISYLKQIYQITEENLKQILTIQLTKDNKKLLPEQTVQELKFKDYEIIQLEQKTMFDLYLINKDNPKQQFIKKISAPIQLKFLQELPQFKDKVINFYDDSQKQISNQDQIKYAPKINIYYKEISQSQIFSWMQIGFMNKQTQEKIIKKVAQNEAIDKYIKELVGEQKTDLWLGDQKISKDHTFAGIGAQNNDCIIYEIIKKSVLVVYKDQNYIIEVQDDWKFENLKRNLLHQFKDSKNSFCLIHRDVQPQLNQNILSIYNDGDIIYFTDQQPSMIINQSKIVDNNLIPITLDIVDRNDEITINVKCKMTVQNIIQKFKNLFQNYASANLILKINNNILPESFEIDSTHRNAKFTIEQIKT